MQTKSFQGEAGGDGGIGDRSRAPFWLRPVVRPASLRAQILTELAVLLFVALVAMASALLLWLPEGPSPGVLILGLVVLVGVDVGAMVLFGGYLLRKQIVEPLERMVGEAEAIAEGDQGSRLDEVGPDELQRLAVSVNRMAERLLGNQKLLAENVRSLDETNRALREAQGELVQAEKLASVGRLAAGIAHEVGNPLGAILGYVELIERRKEVDEQWLEDIREEAARIDGLIRGLLNYARPKAAAIRTVPVNKVVERALKLLGVQGRLKGITVKAELAEASPRVRADPHQLEQVLVNLLLNARDAIESTGEDGEITVRTGKGRYAGPALPHADGPERRRGDPEGINFQHLRRKLEDYSTFGPRLDIGDPVVQIEVSDNGVGLTGEETDRIFDPFYTTKAPGRGTGLGLAVSRSLVRGMGGTIEAIPRAESGAKLVVLLPAAEVNEPVRSEEEEER